MNFTERAKNYYWNLRADNSGLYDKSEVFCMAPWLQLHAQTNGKVAPCCMASVSNGNELGDLRQNPNLEDSWNSENMKQLRLNMLQGKKSSICTHCYDYEKAGKFSERNQYNRDYKHQHFKVSAVMEDGSLKGLDVPLVDIRFSNKCNYKCRICDSVYSSLWHEEEAKTGKIPGLPSTKEMKVANDETAFWKSYKRLLKNVKRLHFAGGEPLFMDEHYEALEYLISIGKTDVTLSYNTNFSTLRYKKYNVVDLWNKFEKVDVWASLDMMGDKGDYQRKGQKWDNIEENIRTVQSKCTSVLFGINATVSIFNVLDIPFFYQYMVEHKFVQPDRLNLYLLFDPPYMNITNLTPALKTEVVERFDAFEKTYLNTLSDTSNIRNHAKAVVSYMMSENGTGQKEFAHWVHAIDAVRNEKFETTFPELVEMVNEDLQLEFTL
ncbi:MAG: twitch domain-containing radical SAM protein [Bacteroidota bacterium]